MIINHNMNALNALGRMSSNTVAASKSMEKLSSGLRINRAGDDAAGLAISEKMRAQIKGLDQATRNSQDGISMIQTGEGALNETHSILQRMRVLAVQSASDTNTDEDRANLQDEMSQLTDEIDRIANTTEFNTKKLLNGSLGKEVKADVSGIQVNTALQSTTATNAALSSLNDRSGNTLGIDASSTIQVSFIRDGKATTTTFTVGTSTIADVATQMSVTLSAATSLADAGVTTVVSTDNKNVLLATSNNAGATSSVTGISIIIKDKAGKINQKATDALSAFTQRRSGQDTNNDGSATLQIGANAGQHLTVEIGDMSSQAIGVKNLNISTQEKGNVAIKTIDTALNRVSTTRSKLGALQNRLDHTINNLGTSSENLTSAESRIRDVDMASEMMNFTKNNILTQAAQSMLAQANQQPQQVLSLLQ